MNQTLKTLGFVTVWSIWGLAGCTKTIIVYKPSPFIKPMPDLDTKTFDTKPDPKFAEQWNLKQIGINEAQLSSGLLNGNVNVKVAILSTGLAYNDDEFSGQVWINRANLVKKAAGDKLTVVKDKPGYIDVVGYDVVDGDGFAYDRHGAGTAVAGIIAARQNNGIGIAGIIKDVSIYPIRYINDNGQTTVDSLIKALEVTIAAKPHVVFIQNTQFRLGGQQANPEVIKVELGLLNERLRKLQEMKIPIVIGSGDNMSDFGSTQLDATFKSYDNVVVVTASDRDDAKAFLANFSFDNVHTAAPGDAILTTKPGNQTGLVSGTAVAAAHVTAALALARSYLGDRVTYDKIIPVLTSAQSSDIAPKLEPFFRAANRLNIPKFLAAIQKL